MLIDKVYNGVGIHIQTIYRYYKASNGSDGASGGNGGKSGVPIIGNISVTKTGTITIEPGNGGDGGNGGNGGKGDSLVTFNTDEFFAAAVKKSAERRVDTV